MRTLDSWQFISTSQLLMTTLTDSLSIFCHYSHLTSPKGLILPQIFRAFFCTILSASRANLNYNSCSFAVRRISFSFLRERGRKTPLTFWRRSICRSQSCGFVHVGPGRRKDHCHISFADPWRHPLSPARLFSVPTEATYLKWMKVSTFTQ